MGNLLEQMIMYNAFKLEIFITSLRQILLSFKYQQIIWLLRGNAPHFLLASLCKFVLPPRKLFG